MTTLCATTEKMNERREQGVNAVLDKFDVWRFMPSGQRIGDRELQHSRVEWTTEDDTHIIRFHLDDDEPAEQIASELRACVLVVSMQPDRDDTCGVHDNAETK